MIRNRSFLATGLCLVLSFLLSGCQLTLLNPKGVIAVDEKHIFLTSLWLMLIVVVPVIILSLAFAWHYRAGNAQAKYSPEWAHSTVLELVWWSIPCVIIAILATLTWVSTHRLDPYRSLDSTQKPITIEAIALEWKWLFIYPEQNIATINFVQFPVGVPISFHITAEGPMNALQIPQLAGQIYAMAGMQTQLHLLANEVGDYQGMSANFSGEGFSSMKFIARASSEEEFKRWVKAVRHSSQSLSWAAYHQLIKPTMKNEVQYYSSAKKELFTTVVMKAMMPMSEMEDPSVHQILAAKGK